MENAPTIDEASPKSSVNAEIDRLHEEMMQHKRRHEAEMQELKENPPTLAGELLRWAGSSIGIFKNR